MTIWAFNSPNERQFNSPEGYATTLTQLAESIYAGRSRFGWSTENCNNLTVPSNRELTQNSQQLFLLKVDVGDWIVHVNLPIWGKCIAAEVLERYDFDEGIRVTYEGRDSSYSGSDFRHFFQVNTEKIVEFARSDSNVSPDVNLRFKYRFQRIKNESAFFETLNNLQKR